MPEPDLQPLFDRLSDDIGRTTAGPGAGAAVAAARSRRQQRVAAGGLAAVLLLGGTAAAVSLSGGDGPDSLSPAPFATAPADPSPDAVTPTPGAATPSPDATPAAPAPSPAQTTPAPTGTQLRAVYYLADTGPAGPRLYREFHPRAATGGVLADAVQAMLAEAPFDDDYTSLWPTSTRVLGATVDGELATVDLSAEALDGQGGSEFEAASLQQLVHTATAAAPDVRRVQVLVEGEVRETLWGAVSLDTPVSRAPAAEILAPVWLLVPDALEVGAQFGGQATVFEATVSWEWLRDGTVVASGFSTAETGAPGRGAWTATVDVPPGNYVLRAFESSAEDGRAVFVDDKPVTVTG